MKFKLIVIIGKLTAKGAVEPRIAAQPGSNYKMSASEKQRRIKLEKEKQNKEEKEKQDKGSLRI